MLRQFFKAVEADSFVLIEVRSSPAIPVIITILNKIGDHLNFHRAGILPEEPKPMEEVFWLRTRQQSKEDKGS